MNGVQSFYRSCDIDLPTLPRRGKAKTFEKNRDIPTK